MELISHHVPSAVQIHNTAHLPAENDTLKVRGILAEDALVIHIRGDHIIAVLQFSLIIRHKKSCICPQQILLIVLNIIPIVFSEQRELKLLGQEIKRADQYDREHDPQDHKPYFNKPYNRYFVFQDPFFQFSSSGESFKI